MKVLVIDDESLIRMNIVDYLIKNGHQVVGEGRNGIEAIELTKLLNPEVVLMDIKMPKLNGIEAARQIRRLNIAPVVLLTAYMQDDLMDKAVDSGIYGYLIKPVNERQIIPALRMAVGKYKELNELKNLNKKLEENLEERKLISQATGIIMKKYNLNENDAYKKIRDYSMQKGVSIFKISQAIIAREKEKV